MSENLQIFLSESHAWSGRTLFESLMVSQRDPSQNPLLVNQTRQNSLLVNQTQSESPFSKSAPCQNPLVFTARLHIFLRQWPVGVGGWVPQNFIWDFVPKNIFFWGGGSFWTKKEINGLIFHAIHIECKIHVLRFSSFHFFMGGSNLCKTDGSNQNTHKQTPTISTGYCIRNHLNAPVKVDPGSRQPTGFWQSWVHLTIHETLTTAILSDIILTLKMVEIGESDSKISW